MFEQVTDIVWAGGIISLGCIIFAIAFLIVGWKTSSQTPDDGRFKEDMAMIGKTILFVTILMIAMTFGLHLC